jgi:hypothetical protein
MAHLVLRLVIANDPVAFEVRAGWRCGSCQVDHVLPWKQQWREFSMVKVNARIHYTDHYSSRTDRDIPGCGTVDAS